MVKKLHSLIGSCNLPLVRLRAAPVLMQQYNRATITIFQGSMVTCFWLQKLHTGIQIYRATYNITRHTLFMTCVLWLSLPSELCFLSTSCLQSLPPLSHSQCFHLVVIKFKDTLLILHHSSGLLYFMYTWIPLMSLSCALFMDAAAIFFIQTRSHRNVTEMFLVKTSMLQSVLFTGCSAAMWNIFCVSNATYLFILHPSPEGLLFYIL